MAEKGKPTHRQMVWAQAVEDWKPTKARLIWGVLITVVGYGVGVVVGALMTPPQDALVAGLIGSVITLGLASALYFLWYLIRAPSKVWAANQRMAEAAHSHARLPPIQRDRVHRIKELAGRISTSLEDSLYFDPKLMDSWVYGLRAEAGAIGEHEELASVALYYVGVIDIQLDAMINVDEEEERRECMRRLRKEQSGPYKRLIETCNELLERYPPPG